MHYATITSTSGKSDITVVVVGHSSAKVPRLVEAEATKLAKGDVGGPISVLTAEGRFLLVKPDTKSWLIGGENWRLLGNDIINQSRSAGASTVTVNVGGTAANVEALVEGMILGDYRFLASKSGKDGKRSAITIRIPGQEKAVKRGVLIGSSQNFARHLADMPPNELNPKTFVELAQKELRGSGLTIKVVSGVKNLRKAGFPGLAQVGQAGSEPPAMMEMRYVPKKSKKGKTRLALVGKGITFDSGGISLKPGAKMWEMKGDMSGAAAVTAAMKAIAQEKPDVPVTGYVALAENLPDRWAQRPGDIYRARNGKWIHVDNTDAEGRLVLADVLTYACEEGATHMVDVATLTGACLVALGDHVAGLMSRHDGWAAKVRSVGQEVGEEFWQLPLYGEYRGLIDHPHADLNNIGGPNGGTITAGIFLSEFVDDKVQWAHCDIAGPAMQTGGWRYYAKGMTGFATRTLTRLASRI